jgi:hypothetical protein
LDNITFKFSETLVAPGTERKEACSNNKHFGKFTLSRSLSAYQETALTEYIRQQNHQAAKTTQTLIRLIDLGLVQNSML